MPPAVLALTAGAFGIGTTEFIIMGLLLQVAADMHVSVPVAGAADLRLCARRLRRRACPDAGDAADAAENRSSRPDGDLHARQCRLRAGAELRMADGGAGADLARPRHLLRRRVGRCDQPRRGGQARVGDCDHVHRPDGRDAPGRALRRLVRPDARLARGILGGDGDRRDRLRSGGHIRARRCRQWRQADLALRGGRGARPSAGAARPLP
ncbi:hypothetical protein ACVWZ3_009175 [Bradyrhizobium sp. i1.3.6]